MTNEKILKKAVEKAESNGYYTEIHNFGNDEGLFADEYFHIIFSHDFAKAFLGKEYPKEMKLVGNFPYWKMELTQMVLKEKPIKYLEKFL